MKNKVKIIEDIQLPLLDIEQQKDFDSLLKQYATEKAKSRFSDPLLMWISGAFIGLIFIGAVVYGMDASSNESTTSTMNNEITETSFIGPMLPIANVVNIEIPKSLSIKTKKEASTTNARQKRAAVVVIPKTMSKQAGLSEKRVIPSLKKSEELPVPVSLPPKKISSTKAHPVDGLANLYRYFQENIEYPTAMRKDSIEGFVKVSFLVSKDSSINSIKIVESLGAAFDEEAISLINGMPKWVPASTNGHPYSKRLVVPIKFNIQK